VLLVEFPDDGEAAICDSVLLIVLTKLNPVTNCDLTVFPFVHPDMFVPGGIELNSRAISTVQNQHIPFAVNGGNLDIGRTRNPPRPFFQIQDIALSVAPHMSLLGVGHITPD
jgi:hypothetical protein